MTGNRLPKILNKFIPKARRNQERPLLRLLDVQDWNGTTGGRTACQLHDDDDGGGDDDDENLLINKYTVHSGVN